MKKSHTSKNQNNKDFKETFGLFKDDDDESIKHFDEEEGRQHPNI